jgi:DNA-binding NtrC family response regulator
MVDVRVISATNKDLKAMVETGGFREDLFYRLRVIPLGLLPLRERREDIIPLIEHSLPRLATRTGRPLTKISPEALGALHDYDYPGNVRELLNILERALVLCRGGLIELECLPREVRAAGGEPARPRLKPSDRAILDGEDEPSRQQSKLRETLEAYHWNRRDTARAIGISRSTLWRRMKEQGLA